MYNVERLTKNGKQAKDYDAFIFAAQRLREDGAFNEGGIRNSRLVRKYGFTEREIEFIQQFEQMYKDGYSDADLAREIKEHIYVG